MTSRDASDRETPAGATIQTYRGRAWRVMADTWYPENTPDDVMLVLHRALLSGTHIRVHYGDTDPERALERGHRVGRDWLDDYNTAGCVGRSAGPVQAPLLLPSDGTPAAKQAGRGLILAGSIVKITHADRRHVLYQHESYHTGQLQLTPINEIDGKKRYRLLLTEDGRPLRRFETRAKAKKWFAKMALPEVEETGRAG